MICVTRADCTGFSTNGNLAPLSAEVMETLNGEYARVQPIQHTGKHTS